jgi:hypothetical protein
LTRRAVALVALASLAAPAWAGKKTPAPPPPLITEHAHQGGAFTFRTPAGWTVGEPPGRPDVLEAWNGPLGVRFVYAEGETGMDALHVTCMLERLAPPMETEPQVKYEYEFVGGPVGEARALDSAFTVRYDEPIKGHGAWRQRVLTVVGRGQSLCLISYVPADVWKRSPEARATADAVLASVMLRGRP